MRKASVLSTLSVLVLVGCAATPTSQSPPNCVISESEIMGRVDARELAFQLSANLCPISDKPLMPLVVSDPVDVQSYLSGHLGRAFGDIFRSAIFNRCGMPIRQVELGREFGISGDGVTALTRNLTDIRGESFQASDAIITTYSVNAATIYFVSRRVDIASGSIQSMATREVSWQCEQDLMGSTKVRTIVR